MRIVRLAALSAAFLMIATALAFTTSVPAARAGTHVVNPYAGATQFVNPVFKNHAEDSAKAMDASNPALAAAMRAAEQQPTAIWLSNIASIVGPVTQNYLTGYGLRPLLDFAVKQKTSAPEVVTIVIYDAPGRDCAATASAGELTPDGVGFTRYMVQYIDPIAAILSDPAYADLRFALVIEPDGLPNMVTNTQNNSWTDPNVVIRCKAAQPFVESAVIYALQKFHPITNAYTFLDIAQSGWMGWPSNLDAGATYYSNLIKGAVASNALAAPGFDAVDGFSSNVSNYVPTTEPFMTASTKVGGSTVTGSTFYNGNSTTSELEYAQAMHSRLVTDGFNSNIGWILDTGRNGWGGTARPTSASTSTVLDTFVDATRIDRRNTRADFCNPTGAGLGAIPQANPDSASSFLWSYVWVKPPGESDGSGVKGQTGYDANCDPDPSLLINGKPSGAMPQSPAAGKWFPTQFAMLVQNAYPALGGYVPPTSGPTTTATAAPGASCQVNGAPKVSAPGIWYPDSKWSNGTASGNVYTGFQATVTVVNNGKVPTTGWTVSWKWVSGLKFDAVGTFQSSWNGNFSTSSDGNTVTVTNMSYNGVIQPGQSTTFGFIAYVTTGTIPVPVLSCTAK